MLQLRTLLFDIDGTLLLTSGAGTEAFRVAFQQEFQIDDPQLDISYGGRTDRALILELLELNGLTPDETSFYRLADSFMNSFPQVMRQLSGNLLPGVRELLNLLVDEPVRMLVMTGNTRRTGNDKLAHFGLQEYFDWTMGGDLDVDRRDLARRTLGKIRNEYGAESGDDLIVIGDTPNDISCAREIGSKVLAVCTGGFDRQSLENSDPDWVVDDLSNTDRMVSLLTE